LLHIVTKEADIQVKERKNIDAMIKYGIDQEKAEKYINKLMGLR